MPRLAAFSFALVAGAAASSTGSQALIRPASDGATPFSWSNPLYFDGQDPNNGTLRDPCIYSENGTYYLTYTMVRGVWASFDAMTVLDFY
jgi:beta-xylosidase